MSVSELLVLGLIVFNLAKDGDGLELRTQDARVFVRPKKSATWFEIEVKHTGSVAII